MFFLLIFQVELVLLPSYHHLNAMVDLKVNLFSYILQRLILLPVLVKVIVSTLARQTQVHKAFIRL